MKVNVKTIKLHSKTKVALTLLLLSVATVTVIVGKNSQEVKVDEPVAVSALHEVEKVTVDIDPQTPVSEEGLSIFVEQQDYVLGNGVFVYVKNTNDTGVMKITVSSSQADETIESKNVDMYPGQERLIHLYKTSKKRGTYEVTALARSDDTDWAGSSLTTAEFSIR